MIVKEKLPISLIMPALLIRMSFSEEETVDNLDYVTADTIQILHYGNYFVKSDS